MLNFVNYNVQSGFNFVYTGISTKLGGNRRLQWVDGIGENVFGRGRSNPHKDQMRYHADRDRCVHIGRCATDAR